MSLDNLFNTPENEYVRGAIAGNVSDCKTVNTKTGKIMFKCKLSDAGKHVFLASFSQNPASYDGKRVKISGMGIKRSADFNGTVQVSIGDKAVWANAGNAPVQVAAPQPTAPEPANSPANAPTIAVQAIPGVTVGMAVNKAVDIAIAANQAADMHFIRQIASDLIRLSIDLQAGNLAPAPGAGGDNGEVIPF